MKVLDPFGKNSNLRALVHRYLWAAPAVAAFSIVIGVLEGVGVGLLIPFLSTLTDSSARSGSRFLALVEHFAQGHDRNGRLFVITFTIFACLLLKSVLQIVSGGLTAWIDGRLGQDIRSALSERLQGVGYSFYLAQDPARLIHVFGTESWRASEALRVVLTRIAATTGVVVFGVLLMLVSWRLTLIVALGGLATHLVQKTVENRIRRLSEATAEANQRLFDRTMFAVLSSRVIRLFNTQRREHQQFEQASNHLRRTLLKVQAVSGALWPVLETMHGALLLLVLLAAVFTRVPLPVLVAFLVLMNRLQPHLRTLEQTGTTFAAAAAQLSEVEWLLEARDKPAAPSGTVPFTGLRESIRFEGVTFEFTNRDEPAVMKASFEIRSGRATALIGGSGAGKSTVINLLCRLLEPVSGSITVDRTPLSSLNVDDWLNAIAIAGQDIDLVEGTIAENVAYGTGPVSREKIDEATRAAHADFVQDLPAGLDTLVGPRGLSLSGGQRQRIGLARALVRDPSILILDEATNAVDNKTESGILQTVQRLPKPLTIIVISHRPSTVAFCDDAIVLERGKVVHAGPFSTIDEFHAMQAAGMEFLLDLPGTGEKRTSSRSPV